MTEKLRKKVTATVAVVLAALLLLSLLPAFASMVAVPACVRCHGDVAQSQARTAHADQACITCHGGTSFFQRLNYRRIVMYHMVLPNSPFSNDTAGLANAHCTTCHDTQQKVGIITARGIRINHRACTEGLQCVICHAGIGHELPVSWQSQYSMNQCLRCHAQRQVFSEKGCEQCHDGRFERRSGMTSSSFTLVHGPDWEQTHGLGDMQTCASCHEQTVCGRCHGKLVPHDSRTIVAQHAQVAREPDNKCATCHRDTRFCDGCHGLEMPHPTGFLARHSEISRTSAAGTCERCHLVDDCTACHQAHVHPGGAGR